MPDNKPAILISACLLGQPVRFDGRSKGIRHPLITHWQQQGLLHTACPEVSGGLPVPRQAAEIQDDADQVLSGSGRVMTADGDDVSRFFLRGAQHALLLCRQKHIQLAILKANSPSCGAAQVYDGSFSGKLVPGAGVTATLLRQNGIHVFNEHEIDAAASFLDSCYSG